MPDQKKHEQDRPKGQEPTPHEPPRKPEHETERRPGHEQEEERRHEEPRREDQQRRSA
jgi:hypothetical protein